MRKNRNNRMTKERKLGGKFEEKRKEFMTKGNYKKEKEGKKEGKKTGSIYRHTHTDKILFTI